MKRSVLTSTAVALAMLCAGTLSAATSGFQCTGESQCIFEIDGSTPQACLEQLEILTGPLTGAGTVQVALVDFKTLDGVCFTLSSAQEGYDRIVQTQTPGGYQFEYQSDFVMAESGGYTFYSTTPLHLRALNLYPNPLGQNPGPITYIVDEDVNFETNDGLHYMRVHQGSSVDVTTTRPKVICNLTSNACVIDINGSPMQTINPTIEIESEPLVPAGGNIQVGYVTFKELLDGVTGMRMTLQPASTIPPNSFFRLDPVNPGQNFPANVRGYFETQIELRGDVFLPVAGSPPLEVESTFPVNEWPPAPGTVQYILSQPIQYVNGVGDVLTIHKGSIQN